MVQIFCKIHDTGGKAVLAVCDRRLLGKTLQAEKIEFKVSEKFYRERELSEPELKKMLHEFDNINLVGNKAVGIALEQKAIFPESVIEIAGEKHVQIFKI